MERVKLLKEAQQRLTVSVVMATYNGEAFIEEQLDSILNQSRRPNEVLLLDDCSSDSTQTIIRKFIEDNELGDKWRLICNEKNLGYTKNYLKGASLATGDLIFYSDQDDIWRVDKIATMADVAERYPEALVVACNTQTIDTHGKLRETMQTLLRKTKGGVFRITLQEQVSSMLSSGLSLVVRSDFMNEMMPIINEMDLAYDTPLGLFSAARGGFLRVGEDLVLHRVHGDNVSNPTYSLFERIKHSDQHIAGREFQLKHLKALQIVETDASIKKLLQGEIDERIVAIESMKQHRLVPLIRQLLFCSAMGNRKINAINLLVALGGFVD